MVGGTHKSHRAGGGVLVDGWVEGVLVHREAVMGAEVKNGG